ncbi:MAG: hypothetical protein PSN34_00080 [Urechidicola sp.]|nr:hypothetical protein [Urechidicola sp.]
MENKEELLKLLGFSEELIEKINNDTFDEVTYSSIPESTSVIEPFTLIPTDLNDIVIEKTQKPQSLVYNSVLE